MAKIDIKATIEAPKEITITLVREDYLETSNTFRFFFEVCLGLTCAIIGNLISYDKTSEIPPFNWFVLLIMVLGCLTTAFFTSKHYKKAKSKAVET